MSLTAVTSTPSRVDLSMSTATNTYATCFWNAEEIHAHTPPPPKVWFRLYMVVSVVYMVASCWI